jgi:hypothetical protein
VVPLTIKHIHGAWQAVVLTQGLPQAVTLVEPVRNWRTESALAEKTARNITAVTNFFTIVVLLVNSFGRRRRGAFWLANACGASAQAKITTAWTFTDIAAGAWASARHNCVCAGSQLVDR